MSVALSDAVASYENYIRFNGIDERVIDAYIQAANTAILDEKDIAYGLTLTARCKDLIEQMIMRQTGGTVWDLEKYCFANKTEYEIVGKYYSVLLLEAQNKVLDSYLRYLEKKREPRERFYMPKRKQFMRIGLIQALQDMLDDKADILCISLPPGTGKTTLSKFFISGVVGWYPRDFNLFFSHSADICRMYYDGVLSILSDDEYEWKSIFPDLKVTNTNAKMMNINIGGYKPFQNLMCGSRGSELAGKVRCSRFLMVDDLIGKQEEALNKNILEKIWANDYTADARQRKIDGCKEIHIATRWSNRDVIGRLKTEYDDNDRVRFIAVPDIDPVTNESNFDYEFDGFSVDFFHDQERLMDEITYKCLYKQEPIEREGLLYHEDELRRYITTPEREPDAILGICDVKNKGEDFMFLPVCEQYGQDFYCIDCVCDKNTDFGVQEVKCAKLLLRCNVQQCQFESNVGGDRFASNVAKIVGEQNGRCNITTKPTEQNKETKIIVNADWVKKHVLFKDKTLYDSHSDYSTMISQLLSYTVAGKNKNDDVPDGWAMFALYVTNVQLGARAEAIANPFRWGGLY
ncbi:MAG: hypothetical protein IJ680_05765 [Paludibacteraceae bacterium]|nr:hypothetical protein [Paludibacteraceae bacterium]